MGMHENWKIFVRSTQSKADSHLKIAKRWDCIHNLLNFFMIFLSSATTILALLSSYVPFLAVAGVSGSMTLLSGVAGFLGAAERKEVQLESSRVFRSLMMRMVRCVDEEEYEELWSDFNKALAVEPLLPKQSLVTTSVEYTMTPELWDLICEKEKGENFADLPLKCGQRCIAYKEDTQDVEIEGDDGKDDFVAFGTFKVLEDGNLTFGQFHDTSLSNLTYGTFRIGDNGDIRGDGIATSENENSKTGNDNPEISDDALENDIIKENLESMDVEKSYEDMSMKNESLQSEEDENPASNDEIITISLTDDEKEDKNSPDCCSTNRSAVDVERHGSCVSCLDGNPFSKRTRRSSSKEPLVPKYF